ncbi:MAG: hypothetical protein P8078_09055, partial [bacterium]
MKHKKNEKGFISGFVVFFVVTLTLMGVGGAILMNGEGGGVASTNELMQTNYAVESAMWLTLEANYNNTLDELVDKVPFSIGGVTISAIDTTTANVIRIIASNTNCTREIDASVDYVPGVVGIYSTDAVDFDDIQMRDEDGDEDKHLIKQNQSELPDVDTDNLEAIASGQTDADGNSLYIEGDFTPPYDGWPNGSFYNDDGPPNIIYIDGNLTVDDNDEVFGIYVVTGSVDIGYRAQVNGIIYTPNSGSTVT